MLSKSPTVLAGLAGGAFAAFLATSAPAAVIAEYRFEPGAFLADSSGNGYDLVNNGPTQDTTNVAAGGGSASASFDGNDYFQTATPLDLTGVRHVRLSFLARSLGTGAGIILETSPNFNENPGGILIDFNENPPGYPAGTGETGVRLASGGYNLDAFSNGINVYESYVVDFNLDAAGAAEVVEVRRDGVLQPDATAYGFHGVPTSTDSFLNAVGYIGARNGGVAGFVGNLDEIRLEAIPEPTSLALLAVGSLGLLARRRRKH